MPFLSNDAVSSKAPPQPWIRSPLVKSLVLSNAAGCNIFLKLETSQPSGSFKSRGIGNLMSRALSSRPSSSPPPHFYASSGGNAGLACATAAVSLQCKATIVVPMSTSAFMISKLVAMGASVVQHGAHLAEADAYLRAELLAHDENGVHVPPFDHPDIWAGNSTLLDEVEEQMRVFGGYEGIVCSVGGGGLFCGIMESLERHGRLDTGSVRVLAMETQGAHSLNESLRKGELSRLPGITSIATSLGATQVAEKAFAWGKREEVTSRVVSDADAALAAVRFADVERMLVEVACSASIAPVYDGTIKRVFGEGKTEEEVRATNVVLVVCGGSNVSTSIIEGYRREYGE